MNFERKIIYKIYSEDGTFIEVLNDVVSNLSITKMVSGGDSEFSFSLDRKMDDFDEGVSIKFNNRVKVYLQDSYNPLGDKLIAFGYITGYEPYLRGKEEGVEVTCFSAISKLSNDFYRSGTAVTASELGVELVSKRADQMMSEIIDHYRSTETYSMISNDYTNVQQTTDNAGSFISFDHRFFNMKHIDAIREASKFLPRNKDGGYYFYWRLNTEGKLEVKNISTSADHTLIIGKHIEEISGSKTIESIVNRVYFWNEKGTVDPDYINLIGDDPTSQSDYDIISEYITDSKITYSAAANLLTTSKIYDSKEPKVRIKVRLNGNYDLSSIEPGQTCKILNTKNNPYKIGSDDVLFINSIEYNVDTAIVELAEAQENFEDIVESERQRLDKEMTWYGFISQALTAAQLAPANRVWSTSMTFSATSGADAYRQVDWTAGIVYIPAGASGTSAQRVVDAGDTGLMSLSTQYYVYLDEENKPTSTTIESGTGTIKEGADTLTDSGAPGWSSDQWKGYIVTIGGQKQIIKSNTSSVLTLEERWTISDQSSAYTIAKFILSYTTDVSQTMNDTRFVLTNVKPNADTASEAIIVPVRNESINLDGQTQIAKKSIVADRINVNQLSAITADMGTITAGTVTGATLQTALPTGSNKVIRLTSSTSHLIDFMIGSTIIGNIECYEDVPTNSTGVEITSVGGAWLSTLVIGSTLASELGLPNTYFGIVGTSGSASTERLVSNARFDFHVSPHANDTYTLGTSTYNWQSLFLQDSTSYGIYFGATKRIGYADASSIRIDGNFHLYTGSFDIKDSTASIAWAGATFLSPGGSTTELKCYKDFVASTSGTVSLGTAGQYWNDVSYKTLTDRGCLGWFDEGVELQDGTVVSDIEAIKAIKKHETRLTVYGKPMLDYKSLPKVSYKPAEMYGKILNRDKDDKPYFFDEGSGEKKYAEDGAEMTSLFSIMIGAIKELSSRIDKLESK